MSKITKITSVFAAVAVLVVSSALAQTVTIGYQQISNPWKVSIADKSFEKVTGYKINWRGFDSGSKVINAMASGDVHIALAGSSPIAAGISRGIPIKLFWITEDIAAAEALVVRNGSNIVAPQDLIGKKLGVPFVSTTHFHTLFAMEQFGIDPNSVKILNMQPNAIAAAWERGDIDAAFVWDPALGRIKKSGKVLITSGTLSSWGKATFDGMVVTNDFANNNEKFMVGFIKTIAAIDANYRDNPKAWGPDSSYVKKIVSVVGGDPKNVPVVLALYKFPTLAEQASDTWLGGGSNGGAAQSIKFTSEFLKKGKKLEKLLPDYGVAVTDKFVRMAMQ